MGLHPGPLATTPDPTHLPSEVIRVLGKLALEGASAHVHIRSGIDSLLGDTHLVVVGGKLHVVARKSSLDPLEDVPLLALPEIDEDGYRSVLRLRTVVGDKRVEVGATEENAVHALVGGLSPDALEVADDAAGPSDTRSELGDEADPDRGAEDDRTRAASTAGAVGTWDVDGARAAFLDLLARRRAQRRAKLKADRAAHERATKRSKAHRRAEPATLRAEIGTPTTDLDGDGVPDPPGQPTSPRRRPGATEAPEPSRLPLFVLVMLVMVGLLAALSRVLDG